MGSEFFVKSEDTPERAPDVDVQPPGTINRSGSLAISNFNSIIGGPCARVRSRELIYQYWKMRINLNPNMGKYHAIHSLLRKYLPKTLENPYN